MTKPYSFLEKWNIYQESRFPLVKHGVLIAAFSSSAVSFSAMISQRTIPSLSTYLVAFIVCLLFFLQLRIADEFKDYEEDCKYRSYRPVPRGIITLPELRTVFILAGLLQLLAVLYLDSRLVPILLVVWTYLACMSKEFGIKAWLKAHPITYMWSHMLIMPMIDFFATATEWIDYGTPPLALYWFVALSFFNGINLEIGRKIRSPRDEETGVETYSFLWGIPKALIAWLTMVALTGICAIGASLSLPEPFFSLVVLLVVLFLNYAVLASYYFWLYPKRGSGKMIENLSGLFTLMIYLMLGLVPLCYTLFS